MHARTHTRLPKSHQAKKRVHTRVRRARARKHAHAARHALTHSLTRARAQGTPAPMRLRVAAIGDRVPGTPPQPRSQGYAALRTSCLLRRARCCGPAAPRALYRLRDLHGRAPRPLLPGALCVGRIARCACRATRVRTRRAAPRDCSGVDPRELGARVPAVAAVLPRGDLPRSARPPASTACHSVPRVPTGSR